MALEIILRTTCQVQGNKMPEIKTPQSILTNTNGILKQASTEQNFYHKHFSTLIILISYIFQRNTNKKYFKMNYTIGSNLII